MKFEYWARGAISFFLAVGALRAETEDGRNACIALLVFMLLTIGCLIYIQLSGETEKALKFRNSYLDSAP
jgi:hypothetical protein